MGAEFGQLFLADVEKMEDGPYIPAHARHVKFAMLQEEHFQVAADVFGPDCFDRLFVLHAIDTTAFEDEIPTLRQEHRVHLLTVKGLLEDLVEWCQGLDHQARLRNTLTGDLFHLLFGFGGATLE